MAPEPEKGLVTPFNQRFKPRKISASTNGTRVLPALSSSISSKNAGFAEPLWKSNSHMQRQIKAFSQ